MNAIAHSLLGLPNLHPILVHFPIVLLPLAVLIDLVAVLRRSPIWSRAATGFYVLGALAAWITAEAGEEAVHSLENVPATTQPLLSEHSDLGHYTLWLFAALAAIRLVLWWRDHRSDRLSMIAVRGVVVVAGLIGLGVLYETADHGGRLVYQHGLAIEVAPASASPSANESTESEAAPTATVGRQQLQKLDDGTLLWQPVGSGTAVLTEVTETAPGTDLQAVQSVEPGAESKGVDIKLDGAITLVLHERADDGQISARLDLGRFQGSAGLVERLGEGHRVDFSIADGKARISRDGSELDADAASVPEGTVDLALSAAGRHLKGMMDGKTVAHGHADSTGPGQAGIELSGSGTVTLYELRFTPLDED